MLSGTHSRTAEVTAAIRAFHFRFDEPHVFVDPYAVQLTSPWWRLVCRFALLHWLIVRKLLGRLRPVHGWILARDAITERTLEKFVHGGGRQYILLGAGFDSIGLRRLPWLEKTTIIEVDHPATQLRKREHFGRLTDVDTSTISTGGHEFVAVDFERDELSARLRASSLDTRQPGFFAWPGVIYYLTDSAIKRTLDGIAEIAAPGSELVFDYLLPEAELPESERPTRGSADRYTTRLGERYISFHSFDDLRQLLADAGFEVVRNFDVAAINSELFDSRQDDLTAMPGFGIVLARRVNSPDE